MNLNDMKGIGEDYLLKSTYYVEAWLDYIPDLIKWGFNTVRLAFSLVAPSYHSPLEYDKMDEVIDLLASYGISVLLDVHNWEDHPSYFGSPEWETKCLEIGEYYSAVPNVIGFQPFNEAFKNTWYDQTWDWTDVQRRYAELYDKLVAVGWNKDVLNSDCNVYRHWSYEQDPRYIRPKLKQSMHWWYSPGQSTIDTVQEWFNQMEDKLNYIISQGVEVVIDEFGPWHTNDPAWDMSDQADFCTWIIDLSVLERKGWNLWLYRRSLTQGADYYDYYNDVLESSIYELDGGESMSVEYENTKSTPEKIEVGKDVVVVTWVARETITIPVGEKRVITYEAGERLRGVE